MKNLSSINIEGLAIAKDRAVLKIIIATAIVMHALIGTMIAQEKEGVDQLPYIQVEERLAVDKKAQPTTTSNAGHQGSITPPGNDNFANATLLTAAGTVSISNVDATGEAGEPIHGAGRGGWATEQNSVWYKYVAPNNVILTITTSELGVGSINDSVLSVYTGSAVNALTPVAESDDYPGLANYSRVSFCLTAGQTYYIAVDGYGSHVGTATLSLVQFAKAPNDNFATPVNINFPTPMYPGLTACTAGATAEVGEPIHNGNGGAASIWYRFATPSNRSITISTVGSNFDTVIAVYEGSTLASLTPVASNDDFGPSGTRSSRLTFYAVAGVSYRVALTGFNAHVGNSLIYFESNREESSKRFDFNGSRDSDIGIFRPSNGQWWLDRQGNTFSTPFGEGSDIMTPADFTGDGKTDIAVWRPSNGRWYILRSEDNSYTELPFGIAGDIPAVGHFDQDARADQVVFRPSTGVWYINGSRAGVMFNQFGANGDRPVVADYDGDGKSDIGIFRPSNGEWWISRSKLGLLATPFGAPGDKTVQADYTGDGRADIAVWRPTTGEWFILRSEDLSYYAFPFGANGDMPAPGDYDSDGKTDPSVFRGTTGTWYRSLAFGVQIDSFGTAGDRPVASSYVN